MKYLYGASVQGIQDFIFRTNRLREIVGASELVEQICTTKFRGIVGISADDNGIILNAAGNIKYVFQDEKSCSDFVKKFPKTVLEMMPNITILQAVVKIENELNFKHIQNLDELLQIQRNKAINISNPNLMVVESARRTAGAGIDYNKGEVIDKAQELKIKAANIANKHLIKKFTEEASTLDKFPFDMDEIVSKDAKSWIAVVHADGNNLGQKLMDMRNALSQETFSELSKKINTCTEQAAKTAFEKVIAPNTHDKIPFRPILLGGDDMTAIVRGDLALAFTKVFLEEFERNTKREFYNFSEKYKIEKGIIDNGLTACAGIAYIKSSYPFHYGVKLSETLCKEAKKVSKSIGEKHSPSSIMFHKVHASFIEEFEDIIEKELKAADNIHFNFGPYFLENQNGFMTIDDLQEKVRLINRKDAPKAQLRTWLTEIKENEDSASQLMQRICSISSNYAKAEKLDLHNVIVDRGKKRVTPIFDIIALSNIQKSAKNG